MKKSNSSPLSARSRRREAVGKAVTLAALLLVVFIINVPLLSMFGTAFKTDEALLTTTSLFPQGGDWTVEHFVSVFVKNDFGQYLKNSAVISAISTLFCSAIAACAGFVLSRYKGPIFTAFSGLIFLLQIFPGMLLLIPMFVLFSRYGMVNNQSSVILYFITANLGFNIMLIRSFFNTIPRELDEAAQVDGCSQFRAFLSVIIPISLPGFATISIMCFLNCWNEFTFSNLLLRKKELQTLTSGLTAYVQQNDSNWGALMAASAIATVPALFFLMFAQRYLVQGLTAGSIKG